MRRQAQQWEDKRGHKLNGVRIQTPVRGGSVAGRSDHPQSAGLKGKETPISSNIGRPLYQQTYYVSSVRDNYLTLISDSMEILQLPLGLIREDIKIGYPIKLRLEYDLKRQQTDENKFKLVEKELYKQYHERFKQQM